MKEMDYASIQELLHKHLKVDGASLDLAIDCFELGVQVTQNELAQGRSDI